MDNINWYINETDEWFVPKLTQNAPRATSISACPRRSPDTKILQKEHKLSLSRGLYWSTQIIGLFLDLPRTQQGPPPYLLLSDGAQIQNFDL